MEGDAQHDFGSANTFFPLILHGRPLAARQQFTYDCALLTNLSPVYFLYKHDALPIAFYSGQAYLWEYARKKQPITNTLGA